MPETELQVMFFIYYLLKAKAIAPHLRTQNNLGLESIETNCVLTSFKNIRDTHTHTHMTVQVRSQGHLRLPSHSMTI